MDRIEHKLRRGESRPREKESSGGLRLGVCLLIFAAAFCLKTFAPETAAELGGEVLRRIDGDLDYQAVLAAVGSFVSGENTLGETVAVIRALGSGEAGEEAAPVPVSAPNPEPVSAPSPETRLTPGFEPSGAAEDALRTVSMLRYESPARPVLAVEEVPELPIAPEPDLPENVSTAGETPPFPVCRPAEAEIGSAFGWRVHPVTEDTRFHYGLDFAAPEGAPVYAFSDGEVLVSGSSETAGNYLVLSHGEGWVSQYFHCSELYCEAGDRVNRGDVIAAVGQTGTATGPNLHFELLKDGAYVDPAPCLP